MRGLSVLLFGILAIAQNVAADGIGAHGGNVVVCPGKPEVTLDYYHASLPTLSGPVKLVDISNMTERQTIGLIRSQLQEPTVSAFNQAMADLGPVNNWIATDLANIDDSGEPYYLPADCKRVTAAARQDRTMYLDPSVYNLLSPSQRGLLIAHEVLYYASKQDSSKNVRNFMRVVLQPNPQQSELRSLLQALDIPAYFYQTFRYGRYKREKVESRPYLCRLEFSHINGGHYFSASHYDGSEKCLDFDLGEFLTCRSNDQNCNLGRDCVADVISSEKIKIQCQGESSPQTYVWSED